MSKNFKKIFYLNLKHKFKKNSCFTEAHFDVLHMLISAKRRLGLPSNSGRLVSAQRRLMASGVPSLVGRPPFPNPCRVQRMPPPLFADTKGVFYFKQNALFNRMMVSMVEKKRGKQRKITYFLLFIYFYFFKNLFQFLNFNQLKKEGEQISLSSYNLGL